MDGVNLYLRTLQEHLRSLFGNLALFSSAKWIQSAIYSLYNPLAEANELFVKEKE